MIPETTMIPEAVAYFKNAPVLGIAAGVLFVFYKIGMRLCDIIESLKKSGT